MKKLGKKLENVIIHSEKKMKCADIFKKVLKDLSKRFKTRFELWNGSNGSVSKNKMPDGVIYIVIGRSFRRGWHIQLNKVFGQILFEDNRSMNARPPSYEGFVVTDGDGQELAEVVDSRITILLPLGDWRLKCTEMIFGKIIEQACDWIFNANQEAKDAYYESHKKNRKERFIKVIGYECNHVKKYESYMEMIIKDIECWQNKLISANKILRDCEEELAFHRSYFKKESEALGNEYDLIMNMRQTKDIKVFSDSIELFTRPIIKNYENYSFIMGEFKIKINFFDGAVRIENLMKFDKKVDRPHPHVAKNGIPCLGNIKEAIWPLMIQDELSTAAFLVYSHLENVDLTDNLAAQKFFYWPIKDETEKEYKTRIKLYEKMLKQAADPKLEENPAPLFNRVLVKIYGNKEAVLCQR